MGIFDDIKNTAGAHKDQVDGGIDKAGDFVDSRTGGQHSEHVDRGQQFLKDQLGQPNQAEGDAPVEPAPADAPAEAPVDPAPGEPA